MNKYVALALILLVVTVMFTLGRCSLSMDKVNSWTEHVPASWGKYKIDTISNEVGLIRLYPESNASDCGLADDDFVKYARDRIDYRREFQFIVFVSGKPLVGERCLQKAFIFYLK